MADRTEKDFFGDGYTTYHDDGSKSHTTKNVFSDGYTTYRDDGSRSHTTKNVFSDGYTTYHSDGSTSHTTKNVFSDGYTTYHNGRGRSTSSHGGYGGTGHSVRGGASSYSYRGVPSGYSHRSKEFSCLPWVAIGLIAAFPWIIFSLTYPSADTFFEKVIAVYYIFPKISIVGMAGIALAILSFLISIIVSIVRK